MKKNILLFPIIIWTVIGLSFCSTCLVNAQGVSINPTGNTADPSAGLDVNFTDKGTLITRMTTAQRNAISNPAVGLLIFNTSTNCFNVWLGSWKQLCANCSFSDPVAGNNGPVCSGRPLNLTATTISGAAYQWSGPNGFSSTLQNPSIANATPSIDGTYTVTASLDGCTSSPKSTSVTAIPFTATGGAITQVGAYTIHTFTTSGIFTPSCNTNVEVLVVAGGGGGGGSLPGYSAGGGGGGGGILYSSNLTLNAQAYPVTVGDGGAAGSSNGANAENGGNSVFSSMIAIGGGGGGGAAFGSGSAPSGGSGGGGTNYSPSGGSGTLGQGNDGGSGSTSSSHYGSGGGGGAASAGGGGDGSGGGNGGDGLPYSISGTTVYYSGGGGGGSYQAGTSGTGGLGGGGNAANSLAAPGTPNTGGGGGGGGDVGSGASGGMGGSGIVIIRYLTP